MSEKKKDVYLPCQDRCTTLNFTYDEEGFLKNYCTFSFLTDNLVKNYGIKERIKDAWRILTGKPIYYAEVLTEKEDAIKFLTDCLDCCKGE